MAKQEHLYQNYVVFDFETGGINSSIHPAMEIAIVILDGKSLKVIATYSALFDKYAEHHIYTPEALKVNGLTEEMCEVDGKPLKLIMQEIIDLIKKHSDHSAKYLPLLVGHNVLFDIDFLLQICDLSKTTLHKIVDGKINYHKYFMPNYFDTQKIAMAKYAPDSKIIQHNLSACVEQEGIEFSDAHRALPDTLVTAELFSSYINNLRAEVGVQQSTANLPTLRYFHFD